MKALEILQKNSVLQKSVEPNYLKEAIAELEALENRSCQNCINNYFCGVFSFLKTVRDEDEIINGFYCNNWELK